MDTSLCLPSIGSYPKKTVTHFQLLIGSYPKNTMGFVLSLKAYQAMDRLGFNGEGTKFGMCDVVTINRLSSRRIRRRKVLILKQWNRENKQLTPVFEAEQKTRSCWEPSFKGFDEICKNSLRRRSLRRH